jgi:hypothetical protein
MLGNDAHVPGLEPSRVFLVQGEFTNYLQKRGGYWMGDSYMSDSFPASEVLPTSNDKVTYLLVLQGPTYRVHLSTQGILKHNWVHMYKAFQKK